MNKKINGTVITVSGIVNKKIEFNVSLGYDIVQIDS